jgi:hypothetical protein
MDPLKVARVSRIGVHSLEDMAKASTELLAEALELSAEEADGLKKAARDAFEAAVIAATGGEPSKAELSSDAEQEEQETEEPNRQA